MKNILCKSYGLIRTLLVLLVMTVYVFGSSESFAQTIDAKHQFISESTSARGYEVQIDLDVLSNGSPLNNVALEVPDPAFTLISFNGPTELVFGGVTTYRVILLSVVPYLSTSKSISVVVSGNDQALQLQSVQITSVEGVFQ